VISVYAKEKLNERESISHACGHYITSGFGYISLYGAQTGKKLKKKAPNQEFAKYTLH
jgi:hypothetical protein